MTPCTEQTAGIGLLILDASFLEFDKVIPCHCRGSPAGGDHGDTDLLAPAEGLSDLGVLVDRLPPDHVVRPPPIGVDGRDRFKVVEKSPGVARVDRAPALDIELHGRSPEAGGDPFGPLAVDSGVDGQRPQEPLGLRRDFPESPERCAVLAPVQEKPDLDAGHDRLRGFPVCLVNEPP